MTFRRILNMVVIVVFMLLAYQLAHFEYYVIASALLFTAICASVAIIDEE